MTNAQTEARAIAPERIWIEQDNCPYFYHEDELSEVGSPVTGYVREDIFAAKDKALERLSEQLLKSAAAAREGADKCVASERDTYLVFADHLSGFALEARRALEAQGGE